MTATETVLAQRLAQMRWVATGLLVAMAVLFVTTHVLLETYPWLGVVNAFAEAGMIGALADWFAVTALFRHPLGLPIPHTAIVPTRKNEIGHALAQFIRENFLTREAVARRLESVDLADRLGNWLAQRANAKRVSRDLGLAMRWLIEAVDAAQLRAMLEASLQRSLDHLPLQAGLSVVIEVLSSGDHAEAFIDHLVAIGQQQLQDNKEQIRARIRDRSPWWLPRFVDEAIYDQLVAELERILTDVGNNPGHPARAELNRRLKDLAVALSDDSKLAEKTRRLKMEFIEHPAVKAYFVELWSRLREQIAAALEDQDSPLRTGIENELCAIGKRVQDDPDARTRLDGWLKDLIIYLVDNYRQPLSETISETIEQWDPTATARRIELYIGRDLQFIRVSGTLVGGSAGVLIYLLVQLIA
jgi:uncharacterized membrane-anchored protein YjiN (DUF445 family)